MKTVIITESIPMSIKGDYTLDLSHITVKPCTGCWSCWLKTPGRCISKELDTFYHHYITADCAIYIIKVKQGFISSDLKALFDRLIPLYLPYISVETGECMHECRYKHYPAIKVYYEGSFETAREKEVFENYLERTFYQFHSKLLEIKPLAALKKGKEVC